MTPDRLIGRRVHVTTGGGWDGRFLGFADKDEAFIEDATSTIQTIRITDFSFTEALPPYKPPYPEPQPEEIEQIFPMEVKGSMCCFALLKNGDVWYGIVKSGATHDEDVVLWGKLDLPPTA